MIRVLLVDDDPQDAQLTKIAIRTRTNVSFDIFHVTSLTDACEELANGRFDIILLDLGLPESHGLETLARLRQKNTSTPVIVLSGLEDEQIALQSVDEGAQDYMLKGDLNSGTLPRVIQYAIQRHKLMSEMRQANELLQRKNDRLAELYETAQRFVDNVSHEFRTPLTVIREFTSIVLDGIDGPINDNQRMRLGSVVSRTDDLSLMVDDLLDISRLEAGLLSAWRHNTVLADSLKQTVVMLKRRASAKNINLVVECPTGLPDIFCDEDKLRRVVINLAVNAIKFTPKGGSVRIIAEQVDKRYIEVKIKDDGPGINPEDLKMIFNRFKQVGTHNLGTSCKGFGLGLNIAQELVRLNLGSMGVASELGQGSAFSFTVPIFNPETIVECFLDHQISQLNFSTAITVRTADNAPSQSTGVIEEFLHHTFKNSDLIYPVKADEWLILASCVGQDVQSLANRVVGEWERFKENYTYGALPDISLIASETWHTLEQRDELVQWFRTATSTRPQPVESECLGRILIVEDEQDVAMALGVRLEAAGFEVVAVNNGQEGLDAVTRLKPDTVLMDIRMPVMDGMTALRKLKSNPETRDTPVIMLSANVRDQQEALDIGARFFIQKPYESQAIVAGIKTAMQDIRTDSTIENVNA